MTDRRQNPPTFALPRRPRVPARVGIPAALTLAIFLLGPRVRIEEEVAPVSVPADVDGYLAAAEAAVPGIRPNEAKTVVWHDPESHARTPLSLVYLHGFSADRHELDPVPGRVAKALGANLFLTRLAGHGRDESAMATASAGDWLADVEEAMAVGARLGERVVLLGTSTGGTLAIWATLQERWRDPLAAVVVMSPNLGLADPNARLLLWPWGAQIARVIVGPERCFDASNEAQARHWTTCYPTRALLPMVALVERVRTLNPASARAPVLVLYSPDDRVVDPGETVRFFEKYGGSPKLLKVVEGVGDPDSHVLAGDILSPGTTDAVVRETLDFLTSLAPGSLQ
jgi:alpha-beta hydrolase superfamily lysophospholipase